MLVALLPVSYALHVLEEWFGHFPEWMALVLGAPLPRPAFIAINAVALIAMSVAARAAVARERNGWLMVVIATVLLINGIAHIVGTLVTGTYSPGLVTGAILYLPLAPLALIRARSQLDPAAFTRGVVVGVALHALVVVVAFWAARW